jgi:chromosome segregation ATPase
MLYNGMKEVRKMDKQIIGMLTDIQSEMKEFRNELKETRTDVKDIKEKVNQIEVNVNQVEAKVNQIEVNVNQVEATVKRIEATQTEDVIAMLKVTNKNSETDFHYLNTRITNIDKRVFNLENRAEG